MRRVLMCLFSTSSAWAADPVLVAPDGAPVAVESVVSAPTAEPVTVTHTYAMRQTFTSQMREPNPFSNQTWRSTHTSTWSLVRWTQTGMAVHYTETTCGLQTDKVFGAETVYPQAFVNAIEVRKRSGTLASAEPGAAFRTTQYAQSFGVRLADPVKEALPTDKSDPRLVDTDGDGHPGATVIIRHPLVGTGHVYVAQRSIARLEGSLQADGSITGVVYTAPNMFKIDADTWWLRTESPQRPHPDPKMSPFVMVSVPDGQTCAQILANKDGLFPKLVPLD